VILLKIKSCPFCGSNDLHVYDDDNYVLACSAGHVWQIRQGKPHKLTKLSKAEASVKIAERNKQFIDEFKQLGKVGIYGQFPEISKKHLEPLRESLLQLVSEGKLEVYIDAENKVNYVLTRMKHKLNKKMSDLFVYEFDSKDSSRRRREPSKG